MTSPKFSNRHSNGFQAATALRKIGSISPNATHARP